MSQVSNEWDNVVRRETLENLLGHDGLGETRGSEGSNHIGKNVVLEALLGQSLGEAHETELGGRVIGLAKVAVEAGSGRGIDDSAILLLSEKGPGGSRHLEGAVCVNLVNEIPVSVRQVLEGNVAENAGIVDDNVDRAKGLDGRLDNLFAKLDRVVVCDSLAASLDDLVNDEISSLERELAGKSIGGGVELSVPLCCCPRP